MADLITSEMMAEAEDTAAREIREKKIAAIRAKEEAASQTSDEEGAAAATGARKGTDALLRFAWTSLVPSLGLSLIWINIHGLLRQVFGSKLFSKYGDEWGPVKVPLESMGVVGLDLLAFLLVLSALALVVAIILPFVQVAEILANTWDAFINFFTGAKDTVTAVH